MRPKDIGHRQLGAAAVGDVVAQECHPSTLLQEGFMGKF
jgi:hypothetical protein